MNNYFIISSSEGRLRAYPYPDSGRQWYGIAKNDPYLNKIKSGDIVIGTLRTISPIGKPPFQVLDIETVYSQEFKLIGIEPMRYVDGEEFPQPPLLVYKATTFDQDVEWVGRKNCRLTRFEFRGLKTEISKVRLTAAYDESRAEGVFDSIEQGYGEHYSKILSQNPTIMAEAMRAVEEYRKITDGYKRVYVSDFKVYVTYKENSVTAQFTINLIPIRQSNKTVQVKIELRDEMVAEIVTIESDATHLYYNVDWKKVAALPQFADYKIATFDIDSSKEYGCSIAKFDSFDSHNGRFITDMNTIGKLFGFDVAIGYTLSATATETLMVDDIELQYSNRPYLVMVSLIPNSTTSKLKNKECIVLRNTRALRDNYDKTSIDYKAYENMPTSVPVLEGDVDGAISKILKNLYIV